MFCAVIQIPFFQLQVSRSIGDVYLKKPEFNREPLYSKFRLREPFTRPLLSCEPSIAVYELQPHDQFIIFASDGLWEHISNQQAVDLIRSHPHNVRCISSHKCIVVLEVFLAMRNLSSFTCRMSANAF